MKILNRNDLAIQNLIQSVLHLAVLARAKDLEEINSLISSGLDEHFDERLVPHMLIILADVAVMITDNLSVMDELPDTTIIHKEK